MTSRIRNATPILLFSITSSDTKEMRPDTRMVTKKMVTTHWIVLFRSRLEASGSVFATKFTF